MPAKHLSRIDEDGIYLHIYNKGVEQREIFKDAEDYKVFLDYLQDYLTAPKDPNSTKKAFQVKGRTFSGVPHQPKNYFNKVELVAYSLMPNHFHLILNQVSKGSIEKFVRSLCTRYSMYFNKKYSRTGALFAGPYKSVSIEPGPQLIHLSRYLHYPSEYSSYSEYLGSKKTSWIKPDAVMSNFNEPSSYKDFVSNYEFDLKEPLSGITLEKELDHKASIKTNTEQLEGSLLSRTEKEKRPSKPRSSKPDFLAISFAIFLLLSTVGFGNIMLTKHNTSLNTSNPTVLSQSIEINETYADVNNEDLVESTESGILETFPQTESKTVRVRVSGDTKTVSIRQEPDVKSKRIGSAKNGDTFELISKDLGWYEVKVASGSGFISDLLIEELETNQ